MGDVSKTLLLQDAIRNEVLTVRRQDIGLHHPLMTEKVLLQTEPINELFLAIRRVIALRETGCCFVGKSGVGKSSALNVVEAMLQLKMPSLCIVRHDAHSQQMPSIRAFFKHFLTSVRHSQLRGETFDLRQRLVNWLVDEAKFSGLNMVVILIDEAQLMKIQDFNFLKDVFNDLRKECVQLITILMAQAPDFAEVVATLREQRRLDLIGRFVMRILPFRAIKDAEDLQLILQGIDEAVFPEESGITWTEFFFPQAFQAGFRIEGQLNHLIKAITVNAPKSKPICFDFPARQAFIAIRAFMIDNAGADCKKISLPKDAWSKAVKYAKIAEAMEMMRVSKKGGACEIEF